jgi:hypothetical protein
MGLVENNYRKKQSYCDQSLKQFAALKHLFIKKLSANCITPIKTAYSKRTPPKAIGGCSFAISAQNTIELRNAVLLQAGYPGIHIS